MRIGSPVGLPSGAAEMSTAMTTSAPHLARETHGHRRHQPAVHVLARADAHRLEHRRHRARGTHRHARVADLEQDRLAVVEVGGDDAQRHLHLLDHAAAGVVAHVAREGLAAQQPRARGTTSR
jgi:hypothetical protein